MESNPVGCGYRFRVPDLSASSDADAPETGAYGKSRGQFFKQSRWNIPRLTGVKIPMKMKTKFLPFLFVLLSLVFILLTGCSQSQTSDGETGELDVTQAYQTVEARLTEAVAQTPEFTATVESTSTETATPAPTLPTTTPSAPTATFLPTFTHTPAVRCDQADAAYPSIDITIPDNTEIPAGQAFTKVWRVVNSGTCNWTANYKAIFVSGEQMSAPASVPITKPVAPGQSIDIEVTMVAPLDPGTYQGFWKLQNAQGEAFGIGPGGKNTFWVQIVVTAANTPTPTATSAPTPQTLVSGSASLNANVSLDFDTLQIGSGGADVLYQPITDGQTVSGHQLVPQAGATLGYFGSGQPTYAQCQNTSKGAGPIDLVSMGTGTYLCYFTNQGLNGWARIDALDTDGQVLTLTILTWAALQP